MSYKSTLVGLVAAFAAACSGAAAQEPFKFRGLQLGMTLTEFRRTPFPDSKDQPDVRIICRGDRDEMLRDKYEERDNSDIVKAGAVECRYYKKTSYSKDFMAWAPNFAGIGGYSTSFLFTPQDGLSGKDQRLFLIRIQPNSKHFESLVQTVTEGFGPPVERRTSIFTTRAGANYDNIIVVWRNGVSRLQIERLNTRLDGSEVLYTHDLLLEEMIKKTEGVKRERAKQL